MTNQPTGDEIPLGPSTIIENGKPRQLSNKERDSMRVTARDISKAESAINETATDRIPEKPQKKGSN